MNIREIAYELYKEDWVNDHVTNKDKMITRLNYLEEKESNYDDDYTFDDYIFDYGFANDSSYVCFNEFIDNEYKELKYMHELFSLFSYKYWEAYLKDIYNSECNWHSSDYNDFSLYVEKFEIGAKALVYNSDENELEEGTIVHIVTASENYSEYIKVDIPNIDKPYAYSGEFIEDDDCYYVYINRNDSEENNDKFCGSVQVSFEEDEVKKISRITGEKINNKDQLYYAVRKILDDAIGEW